MLSRFHLIPERSGRTDRHICYINIARVSMLTRDKNRYLSKQYGARRLLSELPDNGWKLGSINSLLKRICRTGTIIVRQPGSDRPRSSHSSGGPCAQSGGPDMDMGWVHPWVGLGWVGINGLNCNDSTHVHIVAIVNKSVTA